MALIVKENTVYLDVHFVFQDLGISSLITSPILTKLKKKYNVTAIVSCIEQLPCNVQQYKEAGVTVFHIPISDFPSANLKQWFQDVCKFMNDMRSQERVIVVHCAAGISRSCTVLAAYLMYLCRWSPSQAIQHIRNKRRIVQPNPGFIKQLKEWDQYLRSRNYQL